MTLPTFHGVWRPSALGNYSPRTFDPTLLAWCHVTGNPDTAGMTPGIEPGQGTYQEWLYAARNPQSKDGPSAHRYVAPTGDYIDMIDPDTHWAWSNGDLIEPDTRWPAVAEMVAARRRGINGNALVYREYEATGSPAHFGGKPRRRLIWTPEQRESVALQIARDSIKTGLPIRFGITCGLHRFNNTVHRQNCPFLHTTWRDDFRGLIRLAKQYRAELEGKPDPRPVPKEKRMSTITYVPGELATIREGAPLFDYPGGTRIGTVGSPAPLERPSLGTSPDGSYRLVTADFQGDDGVMDRTGWVKAADVEGTRVVDDPAARLVKVRRKLKAARAATDQVETSAEMRMATVRRELAEAMAAAGGAS